MLWRGFQKPSVLPSKPKHSPKNTANSQPSHLSAASAPPSATPSAARCSLPSRRSRYRRSHRGRAARVPIHQRSGRGRHRHHPQPEADSFKLAATAPRPSTCAPSAGIITPHDRGRRDVEILDKEVYICTVSEGGKMTWRCASSAAAVHLRRQELRCRPGPGFIPVDSVTRVRKVTTWSKPPPRPDHRLRQAHARDLDQRHRLPADALGLSPSC